LFFAQISTIQNGSLSRLPVLQVLTLAANRIEQIEPNSLPNSLWFLDLKDNRLPNVHFHFWAKELNYLKFD
jgi:Leucine-rich repeat (LRR) protein